MATVKSAMVTKYKGPECGVCRHSYVDRPMTCVRYQDGEYQHDREFWCCAFCEPVVRVAAVFRAQLDRAIGQVTP